ncbi:cation transporter [Actinotalea solisilvae]|uniref:cation transporter n=1 Tax=Actinotalea solisilvae TaxID=2072922 RepID=UPI0018F1261B|nr:cation transporter [Actinotalea solisilvae]
MSAGVAVGPVETRALTRRALGLARFTVAYNVVEGVVAIAAGAVAGLVSVVGFGVDSAIESAAGVLVAVRLAARLRDGVTDERRERRALRAIAVTFFLLAGYVVVEGVRSLLAGEAPDRSPVAVGVLVASLVVMPLLAAAKRRVGLRLGDRLVLADAAETRICVLLSVSTLAGLVLHALTGATWLDPVAGFVIAAFALHEGREAWEGELLERGVRG